jgi:hypothetical protein
MIASLIPAFAARAADLMIYEDALASGWQDWSWNTKLGTDTANKVTGASSMTVTYSAGWAGLSLRTSPAINTAGYSAIRFSVYGKPNGGKLFLFTQPTDNGTNSTAFLFTPTPNAWNLIDVPLSALGNPAQIARLTIMDWTGAVQPTYNLDTLRLIGKTLPALSLTVDATAARKPISPLIYGINGGSATTADATFMKGLGVSVRRWGGNNTSRVAVQRPLDRCLQPDQYVPPTLPDDTAPLTDAPERPQPQPA